MVAVGRVVASQSERMAAAHVTFVWHWACRQAQLCHLHAYAVNINSLALRSSNFIINGILIMAARMKRPETDEERVDIVACSTRRDIHSTLLTIC